MFLRCRLFIRKDDANRRTLMLSYTYYLHQATWPMFTCWGVSDVSLYNVFYKRIIVRAPSPPFWKQERNCHLLRCSAPRDCGNYLKKPYSKVLQQRINRDPRDLGRSPKQYISVPFSWGNGLEQKQNTSNIPRIKTRKEIPNRITREPQGSPKRSHWAT